MCVCVKFALLTNTSSSTLNKIYQLGISCLINVTKKINLKKPGIFFFFNLRHKKIREKKDFFLAKQKKKN